MVATRVSRPAALAALFVVLAALTAWGLLTASPAAAFQPDGVGPSHSEIALPPCPHGHEDVCDTGGPLRSSSSSTGGADGDIAKVASTLKHEVQVSAQVRRNAARSGTGGAGAPADGIRAAITSGISSLPWLIDGADTPTERMTLFLLSETQGLSPELVQRLVTQPFLQDHTPGDQEAMYTLYRMASDDPGWATWITGLGRFADADGITNDDAKLLAVMSLPYVNDDWRTMVSLAYSGHVDQRSYTGTRGNVVNVAVVREYTPTAANSTRMLELATTAVQHNEELMDAALPTNFMGVLLADCPGCAGANNSWVMQMDPESDWSWTDASARSVLAHEVAHYWWYGNSDWLDEGAANYAAAFSQWRATGADDVYTSSYPCPFYRTIEHLVAEAPDYGDSEGSLCNYSLGERLFIHLDRSTTAADFEQRFKNLYQMTGNPQYEARSDGELLLAAYCPNCGGRETLRGVSEMGRAIARHYGEKIFTNQDAVAGVIPGLGIPGAAVSLVNYSGTNRQYGLATLPATSQDQRRWISIPFPNATGLDRTERVDVFVERYHEETEPWWVTRQPGVVRVADGYGRMEIYLDAQEHRAPGHHWVYVYDQQGRKLAELEYQVIP